MPPFQGIVIMRQSGGWLEDVSNALADLGGEAHLSAIYPKVYEYRKARGAAIGKYHEWVRYYLQQNSRGKGYNIFEHVGVPRSGRWRLK
jgi:hypothetical protein